MMVEHAKSISEAAKVKYHPVDAPQTANDTPPQTIPLTKSVDPQKPVTLTAINNGARNSSSAPTIPNEYMYLSRVIAVFTIKNNAIANSEVASPAPLSIIAMSRVKANCAF